MKSIAEINEIKVKTIKELDNSANAKKTRIVVGLATCGIAAGATPVYETLIKGIEAKGLKDVSVTQTGCLGMCKLEPLVQVFAPGKPVVTYVNVNVESAKEIFEGHIVNGNVVTKYAVTNE